MPADPDELPLVDDVLRPYRERVARDRLADPPHRIAFAALHVVMDASYRAVPHRLDRPGRPGEIAAYVDWDATRRLRERVHRHGLLVAEAMDTAQRYEIGWDCAERLIAETASLGRPFCAGAAADHEPDAPDSYVLADRVAWQVRKIERLGGIPVLLPQPMLCRIDAGEDAYVRYHRRILDATTGPLLLHWLSEAFHPGLRGYFPGKSLRRVMALDRDRMRGVKLSLLDPPRERRLRDELLENDQFVLTGDDFHFASLVEGDDPKPTGETSLGGLRVATGRFSHALLGILDAIPAPFEVALRLLEQGDLEGYRSLLGPAEALGRKVFEPETSRYKAGLAFLSWLNGHQDTFLLPNHLESARPVEHFLDVARLASEAGAIENARLANERLRSFVARERERRDA